MEIVILAGGLGTRIREETEYRPKPMVPIAGKPILWHIMKRYADFHASDFIICAGYKGEVIREYFSNFEVMPLRCQALRNWAAGNWPSYYEDNMIIGLQNASMGFHKEPFCSNFQNS